MYFAYLPNQGFIIAMRVAFGLSAISIIALLMSDSSKAGKFMKIHSLCSNAY